MQYRMELFSTAAKLCMTFKGKSARSTVTPLLTLGGQNVKSFLPLQISGDSTGY